MGKYGCENRLSSYWPWEYRPFIIMGLYAAVFRKDPDPEAEDQAFNVRINWLVQRNPTCHIDPT